MPAHPVQPLRDLRLVAKRHLTDDLEGFFDIDRQIESIRPFQVRIGDVHDNVCLQIRRFGLVSMIFRSKCMVDVYQVGHFAHGFGYGDMVEVNTGLCIGWERGTKQVVGLEIADGFPQGWQEVWRLVQPGFARDLTVG